jgi:membrane protein DedA with SNARE-associated domain
MLNVWQVSVAWLQEALAGAAMPAMIAIALVLTTLLLEDLAIAAGVALAAQGAISWELSFAAVAGGIAIGDLGLYALGLAALRIPALRRHARAERALLLRDRIDRNLGSAILLARVIPGLRLLTYTACGWLRVPLLPFATWVSVAVLGWTLGLYLLSHALGHAITEALGLPLPVAVALPVVALALALPIWRAISRRRPSALCAPPQGPAR